jgi:ABC-type multidrug transport system fused ATPase/permease subunit
MIVHPAVGTCVCGTQLALRMADAWQTLLVNALATIRVNVVMFVFLMSMAKVARKHVTTMLRVIQTVIVTYKVLACAMLALLEMPVKSAARQRLEKIVRHSATGKAHAVHMAAVMSATTSVVRALQDTLESIVLFVHSDWRATNMTQSVQTKGVISIELSCMALHCVIEMRHAVGRAFV